MTDIYPKGLSVEEYTRCVSYNSYNESYQKLKEFRLAHIVKQDDKPCVRFAQIYGMHHEGFTIHNCQQQIPDPTKEWATLEIIDCNNFSCDLIYLQSNNGLGCKVIGMAGINSDYPKHWCSQLNLNILSQGCNFDIFKYIAQSEITYYTEAGPFTTGKTTIKQCHDIKWNLMGIDMVDIDNYTRGLCTFLNLPDYNGELLVRGNKPIDRPYVEPDPTGKVWAAIASSGQDTQLVSSDYYDNAKAYLFPSLSSIVVKPGDGFEVTAVIDIELSTPITNEIVGWFKLACEQENGNHANLIVPPGKTFHRNIVRVIGGWENPGGQAHLWIGPWPALPIGSKITINDMVVRHYG